MAIENFALVDETSVGSQGVQVYRITFDGDGTYPAGGTVDFQDLVRTFLGREVIILGLFPNDCGGYLPALTSDGKLKVYEAAADGSPFDETATADLSETTFDVTLLCT